VGSDIVKLWQTMATTAFLAGKHLTISYTPANSNCGSNSISNLDVVN
jgi:hypothetical protein